MSPSRPPSDARVAAWNEYWSSGASHSCAGSFDHNYEGGIREFWQAVFAALPAQAHLLDLCCGNAPLTRLLFDTGAWRSGLMVTAVDAAQVSPRWIESLDDDARAAISVQPGIDAAALPLPDASIDLCMSQYGIEYVGASAIGEVRRVLKPAGRFAAVMHHADALPVRIAREELQHHAALRAVDGLLAAIEGMLEPMARSATPAGRAALRADGDANRRRRQLNLALQALEQRAAGARWPDALLETRDAALAALGLARERGETVALAALQRTRRELGNMEVRQRELVECAHDAVSLHALLAGLHARRCEIDVVRFPDGENAGWSVQVVMPDTSA